MTPENQQDHDAIRPAEWGAIVVLVGLALMLASSFWGQATDDAFITYRYAQKWMETGEFRFNDDISYGITAPGYAMLLATVASLGAPLGLDVPGAGSLLSLLCLLYLTGLLRRFTRRSASGSVRLLPLVVGVVLLTMPLMLGMWGSENMVAESLVTSSALMLFEKDRPALAGFLAFLGIVIRMDAAVGALIIGLVAVARSRRVPWAFGLAGVLPLVVWLPFLQSHFGSVIPATLEAKRLIVTPTYPSYTAQEWSYLRWALSETACWNILGLAVIGLGTTLRRAGSRWPIVLSLGLWSLTQEVLYRQLGIPCGAWYHLVSLVSLLTMAGMGAVAVGLFVERLLPQGVKGRGPGAGRARPWLWSQPWARSGGLPSGV